MTRLDAEGVERRLGERVLFSEVRFATEGLLWVRGPSGCGKSELLRCVAGLVPHEGSVRLNGVVRGDRTQWRVRVAYVPQDAPAVAQTGSALRGQVESFGAQQGRAVDDPVQLAEQWGLPPDRWLQPMHRLSGGERQRLWLALVLSRRPEVVLLDEPTSALDAESVSKVEQALMGRVGLLVTHDRSQGERLSSERLDLVPVRAP